MHFGTEKDFGYLLSNPGVRHHGARCRSNKFVDFLCSFFLDHTHSLSLCLCFSKHFMLTHSLPMLFVLTHWYSDNETKPQRQVRMDTFMVTQAAQRCTEALVCLPYKGVIPSQHGGDTAWDGFYQHPRGYGVGKGTVGKGLFSERQSEWDILEQPGMQEGGGECYSNKTWRKVLTTKRSWKTTPKEDRSKCYKGFVCADKKKH